MLLLTQKLLPHGTPQSPPQIEGVEISWYNQEHAVYGGWELRQMLDLR
jgi:hypothetical protein